MRAARDSRGWSLDRLAYETSLRLPGDRHVTSEALRRMELGLVKELDLVITAAIDEAQSELFAIGPDVKGVPHLVAALHVVHALHEEMTAGRKDARAL